MSGLGSLFSGMSADNNDALKYSAPKEPKPARAAKPAPVSVPERVSAPSAAASVAVPVPVAKAPAGPSKIMASAAVRMFKVNPSTGAYDAVDGGGLLGCVMMGTGLTFQILVYNGQKVPQATVAITGTFDYTLRDLYMSFADSAGNQWSLLFDSAEVMTVFVRTVVATIVHCATHNPDTVDFNNTIRRALPRIVPAEDEDSTTLALGMSAGVYLTAWEIMGVADYPGDVLAGAPLKRVQAPEDVVKIKLSSTEELIGGLSEALVGLTKNDRVLIGVPPKIFYTGSSDGPLDPTKRSFPGSWVLLEVEVSKMKSSTEKKSKDKKEDKPVKNTVPFESADIDTATNTGNNNSINNNNNNNGNSELAARMARVAQQGNGGGANSQLAGIMSSQRSPGSGNSGDAQRKSFTNNSNSDDNNNRNINSGNNGGNDNRSFNNNNNQDRQQQQGGDRYRDDENQDRHYNSNNNRSIGNNYNNNNNNRNNYQNDNNHQYSDQRRSYNNNNNNDYQENRLAVIEGQGARSYYDAEDDGNHHNNRYNNNNSNNYNPQRGAPASAPVASPVPAVSAADSALTATGLIQLHQSVAAVQQSMLQLHTKLDQVGTQVTNSAALQQQQLVATSASAGAVGMPGMSPNPYLGMANPLQQQQMQFQLLQQQQQQQQMMMGGYHHPVANTMTMGASTGGAGSVQRIKTEELVSSLQALLVEYEKHSSSGGGSGGGSAADVAAAKEEAKAAAKALKATIEKLEEKNDTLQTRYDKLMAEKSDLMEKYMEQFQTGSAATNKLYQSQQQLDSAKEQTMSLQKEVDFLKASLLQAQQTSSASNSNNAGLSKEKDQEQKTLIAELQHQVMSLQMEVMESKQALQHSQTSSSDLQALQAVHAQQTQELAAARADSANLKASLESLQQAQHAAEQRVAEVTAENNAAKAKIAELQAALEAAQGSSSASGADAELVQQLQSQVADLTSKLSAAESTSVSLNQALDSVAATAQVTNDRTAETIADLERQLAAALAKAEADSGTPNIGKADAEELKSIMQDVYLKACEVFDPEAEDSGEPQYSTQDIVKRLRAVLKRVTTDRNSA